MGSRRALRWLRVVLPLCIAIGWLGAMHGTALATANYVYHEATTNDVTGGAGNNCGSTPAYRSPLNPTGTEAENLKWKIEYQYYTTNTAVYYTTDGSNPSGAFGTPTGTTQVVFGAYLCTFNAGSTVDVAGATIPAQTPGTTVKYIISAWHNQGGDEIFANSGTCGGCGDYTSSSQATVFSYTVGPTSLIGDGPGGILTYGQSAHLVAQVTVTGDAVPTGTVTFKDQNGNSLGSANVTSTGGASTYVRDLPAGNVVLTDYYSGDQNYQASHGSGGSAYVNQDTPTLALNVLPANPVTGQAAEIDVTATNSQGADCSQAACPTGNVTLKEGSNSLGSDTLTAGTSFSSATFDVPFTAGRHTLTAVYDGDTNYAGTQQSGPTNIYPADTSVSVVSDTNPSTYTGSVTFTATVSVTSPGTANAGPPTGTVEFFDGSDVLCTPSLTTVNGVTSATCPIDSLAPGQHTITAAYDGDNYFNSSSSSGTGNVSQVVNPIETSVSTGADNHNAGFGQPVLLTATVTTPGYAGTIDPTGSVSFFDNNNLLSTQPVSTSNGVTTATFSAGALEVGPHTITAQYTPDNGNFGGSTDQTGTDVVVGPESTYTRLFSSANPSQYGQKVTFNAVVLTPVVPAGGFGGTVTFYDDNGQTNLGTEPVSTSNGQGTASLDVSTLSVGDHAITAVYSGSTDLATSSAGQLETVAREKVNPADTTVTTKEIDDPTTYGEETTFVAQVTVPGGAGPETPSGTVNFYDGSNFLGSAPLQNEAGTYTAGLPVSTLSAGNHTIYAQYGGDLNYNSSYDATGVPHTVNPADTTTSVVGPATAKTVGDSITFTATVSINAPGSDAAAGPSGTVEFYADGRSLGSSGLTNNAGVYSAPFSTDTLAAGNHTVTATYHGDSNFNGSSDQLGAPANINPANTSLAVDSSLNPVDHGTPVTFTATLSAEGSNNIMVNARERAARGHKVAHFLALGPPLPTGTVTFYDNGQQIPGTASAPNPALVSTNNGMTTATLTITFPHAGNHNITATYSGDSNYNGSDNTGAPFNQSVSGPTRALVAAFSADTHGKRVTFRWHVANGAGIAGFYLTARGHRLNAGLIRIHAAHAYRYTTNRPAAGPYALHTVLLDGREAVTRLR